MSKVICDLSNSIQHACVFAQTQEKCATLSGEIMKTDPSGDRRVAISADQFVSHNKRNFTSSDQLLAMTVKIKIKIKILLISLRPVLK